MDYGKKNDGFDAERKNGLREGFGNGNEQPNFTDNGNEQPSFFDFSWNSDAYADKTDKPEKTIGSPTDEKNEKTSEKGIEPTYEKKGRKPKISTGNPEGKSEILTKNPKGNSKISTGRFGRRPTAFRTEVFFPSPKTAGESFSREKPERSILRILRIFFGRDIPRARRFIRRKKRFSSVSD